MYALYADKLGNGFFLGSFGANCCLFRLTQYLKIPLIVVNLLKDEYEVSLWKVTWANEYWVTWLGSLPAPTDI